jgi:hypothetical protein
MPGSRDEVVEILFERQEDMSKWSSSVNDCRVCIFIYRNEILNT